MLRNKVRIMAKNSFLGCSAYRLFSNGGKHSKTELIAQPTITQCYSYYDSRSFSQAVMVEQQNSYNYNHNYFRFALGMSVMFVVQCLIGTERAYAQEISKVDQQEKLAPKEKIVTAENFKDVLTEIQQNSAKIFTLNFKFVLNDSELKKLDEALGNNSQLGHIKWCEGQQNHRESRNYLTKIHQKLKINNENYRYFPKDIVYGYLSRHVYQDSIKDQVPDNELLSDWKVHQVFDYNRDISYYAVAYKNDKTKQIVLAFRGTEFSQTATEVLKNKKGDWHENIRSIAQCNIGLQLEQAYDSTRKVIEWSEKEGYSFSTTGHSLGAWLAELSAFFCHNDFNYKTVRACTFDSPGSEPMMKKLLGSYTTTELINIDVISYLSVPNPVNSCNPHIGKIYRVFPKIHCKQYLKKVEVHCKRIGINVAPYTAVANTALESHSLEVILKEFDQDTGIAPQRVKMQSWPHMIYNNPSYIVGYKKRVVEIVQKLGVIPGFIKKFTIGTQITNQIFQDGAALAFSDVFTDLFSGKISVDRYFQYFEYIDKSPEKADEYVVIEEGNFGLRYKAGYRVQQDELNTILTSNRLEHYLVEAKRRVVQSFTDSIEVQLKAFLECYTIEPYGTQTNSYKVEPKGVTLDILLQRMQRLIEIDIGVRNVLEGTKSQTHSLFNRLYSGIRSDVEGSFQGRIDKLNELEDKLSSYQVVTITGFGGVGKSFLAHKYGYEAKKRGHLVRVVTKLDMKEVENLAKDLDVPDKEIASISEIKDLDMQRESYKKAIFAEINKEGCPTLYLILDQIDTNNRELITKWLSTENSKKLKIIITTRDTLLLTGLNYESVDLKEGFKKEEATAYLRNSLRRKISNEQIAQLISTVGLFPLRLKHAAAYLDSHPTRSVEQYTEKYSKTKTELRKKGAVDKEIYPDVYMLFEGIPQSSHEWEVLKYLASMPISAEIPISLLDVIHDKPYSWGYLITYSWRWVSYFLSYSKKTEIEQIIENLLKYSLVSISDDQKSQSVLMHDIVKEEFPQKINEAKIKNRYKRSINYMVEHIEQYSDPVSMSMSMLKTSLSLKDLYYQDELFTLWKSLSRLLSKGNIDLMSSYISEENLILWRIFVRSLLKEYEIIGCSTQDFLYILTQNIALASYYMNSHRATGAQNAQNILSDTKRVIESFINLHRTDKLKLDELEDTVVCDLLLEERQGIAEMYTKVLYFLGRTYFYFKEGSQERSDYLEKAKRYFERAHLLGKKAQLFEAFQSHLVGLGRIKRDEAVKLRKEGKFRDAEKKLEETLALYDNLAQDKTEYKLNYDHKGYYTTTRYQNNPRCQLDLWESKIKCYIELLAIDGHWVDQLVTDFTSNVHLNIEGQYVDDRKRASVLNTLSQMLFVLETQTIGDKSLNQILKWVSQEFKIDLTTAENIKPSDISLKIFEKAYELGGVSHMGIAAAKGALDICTLKAQKEPGKYQQAIDRWNKRYAEMKKKLQDDTPIAGDHSDYALVGKATMLKDLEVNALLLNIEILQEFPVFSIDKRLLVIDSDEATREYSNRKDIEVIYTNTQGQTSSCADNALCTVTKAKSLGIDAFVYIQDNHAVAVIQYKDDDNLNELLQSINSVDSQEDEQLWQLYKEVIVGQWSDKRLIEIDHRSQAKNIELDEYITDSDYHNDLLTTDSNNLMYKNTAQNVPTFFSKTELTWLEVVLRNWRYSHEIKQLKQLLVDKDIQMSWQESLSGNNYRKISPKLHPDKGGTKEEFQFYNDFRKKFNEQDIEPIIQELQFYIHKTAHQLSVTFKTLDTGVDVVRTYYKPTMHNIAHTMISGAYLLSMTTGITKVSAVANIFYVSYIYYDNGIYEAAKSAATSAMFMVAPYTLAFIGIPHIGLLYTVTLTAYTGVNLASNVWSLYKELTSNTILLESTKAYQELCQKMSDLTDMEWFSEKATEYEILLEIIKQEMQEQLTYLNQEKVEIIAESKDFLGGD